MCYLIIKFYLKETCYKCFKNLEKKLANKDFSIKNNSFLGTCNRENPM